MQALGRGACCLTPNPTPHSPSLCQQQLPATGVPITHQRFDQMRDMFDDYVRARTLHNWKFWVVSSPASGRVSTAAGPGYARLQAWFHSQAGSQSCSQGNGLRFHPLLLGPWHCG